MSELSVYVIRATGTDQVKIGSSRDVPRRLRQLQTSCPFALEIAGTRAAGDFRQLESELHKSFREFRSATGGEWFGVEPEAIFAEADRLIEERSNPPAPPPEIKRSPARRSPDGPCLTFREAIEMYGLSRGRLTQITKGYKDSRTKKKVRPKLTYGTHWVRKTMQITGKDGRLMKMYVPVFTEEGTKALQTMLETREAKK